MNITDKDLKKLNEINALDEDLLKRFYNMDSSIILKAFQMVQKNHNYELFLEEVKDILSEWNSQGIKNNEDFINYFIEKDKHYLDKVSKKIQCIDNKENNCNKNFKKLDIKIITGISGAGKSTVIRCFEDFGYYCVDNLLPDLLDDLFRICKENDEIDKIAIGIDVRSKGFFEKSKTKILKFLEQNTDAKMIFLDANTNILVERFKETRRTHPLNPNGTIIDGIKEEKEKIKLLKENADYIIDTSNYTARELSKHINNLFYEDSEKLGVIIQSFGFKNGLPLDSDLLFDVRFLKNPYYIKEMKNLTGNDNLVYEYVMNMQECKEFMTHLKNIIDFLLPNYIKEDKKQVVISIGCTGGKHRSVSIANKLNDYLKKDYNTILIHRDINKREDV